METEIEERVSQAEERLPGMDGGHRLLKFAALLFVLALVNAVTLVVSFGWGIIVTLPLTIFIVFLVARDMMPRNTYPWSGWRAYWRH